MIQVKCSKCNATGISKNPYTRSVFFEDKGLATAQQSIPSEIVETDGRKQLVIKYNLFAEHDGTINLDHAFRFIASMLVEASDCNQIDQFLCTHDFHPANEEERAKIDCW